MTFWNTLNLTSNFGTPVTYTDATGLPYAAVYSGPKLPAANTAGDPWSYLFYLNSSSDGKDPGYYKYINGAWSLQFRIGSAPSLYIGREFPPNPSEGTYSVLASSTALEQGPGVYRYENGHWNQLETYGPDGLSYISTPLPTTNMTGGAAGATPTSLLSDAGVAYPTQVIDASKRPAAFSLAPSALTASEFLSWNSTFQRDYIIAKGFTLNGSANKQAVTVGPAGSQTTVFLSSDENTLAGDIRGQKLYVVENLQKTDVGMMTLADQKRLAVLDAWSNATTGAGTRLGFTPTGTVTTATVDATRNSLKTVLDGYKTELAAVGDGIAEGNADVFRKQIENLKTRLDNMAVFNEQAIKDAADAIKDRYKRAAAFGFQWGNNKVTTATQIDRTLKNNVVSTDGNQTITSGFDKFMAAEINLLQLDNAKLDMAKGLTKTPFIDLPRLIFLIQLAYQLTNKKVSEVNQEELRQQNKYLQDVAIFQTDLQTTLAFFGTKSDETHAFMGYDDGNNHVDNAPYRTTNPFTGARVTAFEMFENLLTHTNGQHPIQKYRDLPDRPTASMLSSFKYTPPGGTEGTYGSFTKMIKTSWDTIVTKVNDHVTLIQQQNQVVQNTISSQDKEANRHYDLATNALSKMFDMIANISRST